MSVGSGRDKRLLLLRRLLLLLLLRLRRLRLRRWLLKQEPPFEEQKLEAPQEVPRTLSSQRARVEGLAGGEEEVRRCHRARSAKGSEDAVEHRLPTGAEE